MLKEHIHHIDDIPINIFLTSVKEYPIHRHEGLELVYVLEGKIDLRVSYYTYALNQGDVFIVNAEDLHSIFRKSEDNVLLILQVDIESYKKYYPDIAKIIFVSESHYKNSCSEEIEQVKQYLAKIIIEVSDREENYKECVNQHIHDLLMNLIDNFQYFSIEDQRFINENKYKGDKLQIERIYRLTDYLYKNYMKKITLDQLAEKEHLSKYYLSHLIKYATGLSFQDLVNFIRLEQSEIALLGSNRLIGEISFDYGFSSQRYFNSNFKKCFGMTPSAYRKKYKNQTIEKKNIEYLEFDEQQALAKLKKIAHTNYLNRESKLLRNNIESLNGIDIDIKAKKIKDLFLPYLECITLSNFQYHLTLDTYDLLKECQADICFEHVRVNLSFEDGLSFIQFERWIEWIKKINLKPIFFISKSPISEDAYLGYLDLFLKHFIDVFGIDEIKQWKVEMACHNNMAFVNKVKAIAHVFSMSAYLVEGSYDLSLNPLYDTSYMPSFIIDNLVKNKKSNYANQWMLTDRGVNSSKIFHGGEGIFTINGMKKASYYALYLLSKMSTEIIYEGEGYMVTRKGDDIQILIYCYQEALDYIFNGNVDMTYSKEHLDHLIRHKKEYAFKIYNLENDYIVKRYHIRQADGCAYEHWQNLGSPKWLSLENKALIEQSSFPNVTFSHTFEQSVLELHANLALFDVELITLEKSINYNVSKIISRKKSR